MLAFCVLTVSLRKQRRRSQRGSRFRKLLRGFDEWNRPAASVYCLGYRVRTRTKDGAGNDIPIEEGCGEGRVPDRRRRRRRSDGEERIRATCCFYDAGIYPRASPPQRVAAPTHATCCNTRTYDRKIFARDGLFSRTPESRAAHVGGRFTAVEARARQTRIEKADRRRLRGSRVFAFREFSWET